MQGRGRLGLIVAGSVAMILGWSGPTGADPRMGPGDLDESFGEYGQVVTDVAGQSVQAFGVTVQPDGRIVVVGEAFDLSSRAFVTVRYLPDGMPDPSFDGDGVVVTSFGPFAGASAVAVQPDGRIVVAGYASDGFEVDVALARYLPGGAPDPSFGAGGTVTTDVGAFEQAFGMALQPDGRIVVVGVSVPTQDFLILRYEASGDLDASFGEGGHVLTDFGADDGAREVAVQSTGRIVVAGATGSDFALARYRANGSPDNSFGEGGRVVTDFGGSEGALAVAVRAGRIVAAGTQGGVDPDFAVARYLGRRGVLDETFDGDGRVTTDVVGIDIVAGLAVQPDSRILVAGTGFNGTDNDFSLVRYAVDGSLDLTFGDGGFVTTQFGDQDRAWAIALQADGRIVVAGSTLDGRDSDVAVARYLG